MTTEYFFTNKTSLDSLKDPYALKYACGCYQENIGQGYRLYPCIKHDKQILDLIIGDNS